MDANELKSQQKVVITDWLSYFTELKQFRSSNKLFKRVGPFLVGIELWPIYQQWYRVCFIVKSLMHDFKEGEVYAYDIIFDKGKYKGMQLDVRYYSHKEMYLNACLMAERQSMINLWGEVSLQNILTGFLHRIKCSLSTPFWEYYILLQLSYLLDNSEEREYYKQKALEEFIKYQETMPDLIKYFSGVSIASWNTHIQNLNKDRIIKTIELNIERYKLHSWYDYFKW